MCHPNSKIWTHTPPSTPGSNSTSLDNTTWAESPSKHPCSGNQQHTPIYLKYHYTFYEPICGKQLKPSTNQALLLSRTTSLSGGITKQTYKKIKQFSIFLFFLPIFLFNILSTLIPFNFKIMFSTFQVDCPRNLAKSVTTEWQHSKQ